ncbi:class I SAM-dependent methyltransferase [Providencia manganoxydans]|uniref:class I SAM-dependent methyltransferase n=1 Tax=Providencia manganoxydans TaxID=2923283 RepID=UPI0029BFCA61|nr:class I SAM-dependent methyltransferase [Providencia manganoxydans]MDX4944318.1 class I SAM-dependent methyltransferase [Providencia manganoxydans]
MTFELSTHKTYSDLWKKESDSLDKSGVYEKIAAYTPAGNVLEFGCGAGQSTSHLLKSHEVLSLENNEYLIAMASDYLLSLGFSPNIRKCDFYTLGEDDKQAIRDFAPKVITGWFIGGSGEDQTLHIPNQLDPRELMKSYREGIEDIIVSPDVCIESVEYIQLGIRSYGLANSDKQSDFTDTKKDYNKFVFNQAGFEVIAVDSFAWEVDKSVFPYASVRNPNFNGGKPAQTIPLIISILAKRISG